ncbi:Fucose permease [Amycolatopsis marina]|uniref:Fucose permease n=1 Tax=Amycolatopsis marina TaxID=490629 RepID=A0A1I0ZKB0_9PSEU|nr:MFS transporter [Amycolatopsis marina]SFB26209.1 Fucose permease [Amycolatopsis marina]
MDAQRLAVTVVFAINGAALGSWAPRVPALAEQIGAEPGALGLALLGASIGMLVAAMASGRLIERFGSRAVVAVSTIGASLVLPAIGASGSVFALGVALAGLGVSMGVLDVGMNTAGVVVERRLSKPIMATFHAGFSGGALLGSAAAALAAASDWTPARHLTVAAVAALVVLALVIRSVPGIAVDTRRSAEAPRAGGAAPARRVALWLLAVVALCSAIAEGASSDWSALLLVSEQGMSEGAAALAFSAFSLAMVVARLAGAWVQARIGSTRLLVGGALCAGIGLCTAALIPVPTAGFAGFVLAGAGLAASFPVALSLAGEAGKRADNSGGERELAFVTAVAYTGFLAGPPVIGGIAQVTSLSDSFVVVGLVAALIAPAALAAARSLRREQAGERTATSGSGLPS